MILTSWPCPLPNDAPDSARDTSSEMALAFAADGSRADETTIRNPGIRLLVLPALFDEANRLRRFTVSTMRRLASLGIASVLPDLTGCGESLQPLERQDLTRWRAAAAAAAAHFGASHVLTIRASACLAPPGLPGWHYAPHAPSSQLRQLLRARTLASREAGIAEGGEGLLARGMARGLDLAGYPLGPAMIAQLHAEAPNTHLSGPTLPIITQNALAAPGLWLRAEPGEDAAQATRLATLIAHTLSSHAPHRAPTQTLRAAQ